MIKDIFNRLTPSPGGELEDFMRDLRKGDIPADLQGDQSILEVYGENNGRLRVLSGEVERSYIITVVNSNITIKPELNGALFEANPKDWW